MKVNEFFKATLEYNENGDMQLIRPQIICGDGTSLSVQASFYHYCSPRKDGYGHYYLVEVGYPSAEVPPSWKEYQDGDSSVYGYIPVYLVEEYISLHGEINFEKTMEDYNRRKNEV